MTDYTPNHSSEDSIEETRRKKLEEFKRNFDQSALRGDYDVDASYPSAYADDPDPLDAADPDEVRYDLSDEAPAARRAQPARYADEGSSVSYASDDTPLKRRKRDDEINSFSNSDTKKRIERDSKKALKEQKKEEKRIEKSKAKRNRRIFKWVWLSMIAIIAVMISQFVIVGMNDMLAINRTDNVRTVSISIPANPTLDQISQILYENGVISRPKFFKMYAQITSSEKGFRQGEFKLDSNKDYEAIINTLQSNSSRTDIVTVQITEGMSIWEIANLLHNEGVTNDVYKFLELCNSDDFDEDYTFLQEISSEGTQYYTVDGHEIADAYKLEGYLFPDTYDFYIGEDPAVTIEKMLSNYENKILLHKEKYFGNSKKSTIADEAQKTGYSMQEILTIASIIQAEAANKDDMYTISSILHNRLEYGSAYGVQKLNCDCTVHYPWRSESDVPESLRATYTSRYDTNTFNGLPQGAICNPGIEAIKAALHPYDTDYLYFCHDTPENGSTPYYAETLEDHEYNLSIIGK